MATQLQEPLTLQAKIKYCEDLKEHATDFTLLHANSRYDWALSWLLSQKNYPDNPGYNGDITSVVPSHVDFSGKTIEDADGNIWRLVDYVNGAEESIEDLRSGFGGYIWVCDELETYRVVIAGSNFDKTATRTWEIGGGDWNDVDHNADAYTNKLHGEDGVLDENDIKHNEDLIQKVIDAKDIHPDYKVILDAESKSGFNAEYSFLYAAAKGESNLFTEGFILNGLSHTIAKDEIINHLDISEEQYNQFRAEQFPKITEVISKVDLVGSGFPDLSPV